MTKQLVLPFALAFSFACSSALAQWDVAADFDIANNPGTINGGVWSYGHMQYVAGVPEPSSFLLYDEAGTVVDPNAPFAWQDLAAASVDTLGAVSFNESTDFKTFFGIDWEPMEVNLVPDQSRTVATTVRFTAPEDGLYAPHAEFADNQNCCAGRESDAWLLSDIAPLFNVGSLPTSDGLLTHATGTQRDWVVHDDFLSLAAGESIYFASGAIGPGGDHVALRATVDRVTETVPDGGTTLALFSLSFIVLLGLKKSLLA